MLMTSVKCWCRRLMKRKFVTKMVKKVINILKLSPTHFVSNIDVTNLGYPLVKKTKVDSLGFGNLSTISKMLLVDFSLSVQYRSARCPFKSLGQINRQVFYFEREGIVLIWKFVENLIVDEKVSAFIFGLMDGSFTRGLTPKSLKFYTFLMKLFLLGRSVAL